MAARECYIAMLEMEDHQQTMCIGEQRTMAEPVEKLEEVILNESRPGRTTRMGTDRDVIGYLVDCSKCFEMHLLNCGSEVIFRPLR